MNKAIIILNPKAGKGKSINALSEVLGYLNNLGFENCIYKTQIKGDCIGINAFLNEHKTGNLIVIMGGDGTLNDFVNAAPIGLSTPVLCLPGGSGNDFATWLHGHHSLKEIFNQLDTNTLKPIQVSICNGKKFINGLGIGFDGWVAGKANSGQQWLPPSLKYHLAILSGLFTFRSFYTNLGQSLILAVANAPTYGGGFKVAPNADPTDAYLDFWNIKPIPTHKRPYFLSFIKKGKHANTPGPYESKKISEINIQCHKPLPAHIDGEFFEAERFEIKTLGEKLMFYTTSH